MIISILFYEIIQVYKAKTKEDLTIFLWPFLQHIQKEGKINNYRSQNIEKQKQNIKNYKKIRRGKQFQYNLYTSIEQISYSNKIKINIMDFELKPGHFLFTSENVTSGHPDKLCDYISDSVLDACLAADPEAKVACQSAVKNSLCMVFGEISTSAQINIEQVARQAIKEIGYTDVSVGMDNKTATIIVAIDRQSPEIANSVHVNKKIEQIGAGDQGLMIGYASDETQQYMPLSHSLCGKLIRRLEEARKKGIVQWMRPDAKVQVTVEYKKQGNNIIPLRVATILISCQHNPGLEIGRIQADLIKHVIQHCIPKELLTNTKYVLNPSGAFVIGGPTGDAGLTGRKIICDTYGGWGGHGGGAFSGKDPSKVDRSAAYAARWIAKNLVANGFCKRCMVQVAYAIGIAKPLSIHVDSYGTVAEGFTDHDLQLILYRNFDLRPGFIIQQLNLKRPIYKKTASGGHFGRDEEDFTWEKIKDLSHEKKKKTEQPQAEQKKE